MGYAKVKAVSEREVKLIHQLGQDGEPYAEDVTITIPEGVDPTRIAHLVAQDGKIGVLSYSFSPANYPVEGVPFPEE